MTAAPPRVLVVDDSAFVRKVLTDILTGAGIDVIGLARDGLDALEKIGELRPDVVTLDLMMPHLDGVGVLAALQSWSQPPAVVVVSVAGMATEPAIEALQRGALAIVEKPTALATERLYEIGRALVAEVQAAALARPRPAFRTPTRATSPSPRSIEAGRTDLVVLGASTGGPQALTYVVTKLPAPFPVPVALVLHIPPGYTAAFAERLDAASALHVVEAEDGLPLRAGAVVVARAGIHLRVERDYDALVCRLAVEPLTASHRPSLDVLFTSAAEACGDRALGVVLTGMGNDGTAGARALVARGGRVLAESAATCVVDGMPRSVREAGLAAAEAPLPDMVDLILREL